VQITKISRDALDWKPFQELQVAAGTNQNADRVTCADEFPGNVAAHEPRGTRDKRGHKMRKTSSP
jgi:hypothetical protein